jgi:hypothetical protein
MTWFNSRVRSTRAATKHGPLAILTAAVIATVPAIAEAATSHARLWNNAPGTITCGLGDVPPDTPAFLCGGGFKGGYAVLDKTGKSTQAVIRHHEPFTGTPPGARLAAGSTWSLGGISCTIAAKTVTCKNRSGHGFTVSSTRYKSF